MNGHGTGERERGPTHLEQEGAERRIAMLELEVRRYRETLQNLSDAVMLQDDGGLIVYWNPAAERMFGYSQMEALGRSGFDLVVPERLRREYSDRLEGLDRTGTAEATSKLAQLVGRHKDGHEFPIEAAVSVVRARGNLWAAASIRDVSARKRAEHELEASETRYRRLFEAAKDGILILDADSGVVVDANPFLTELTGQPREALLGKHLWDLGPFKDVATSLASFADLLASDYVRYEDLPLQASDGRTVDVEFISNVYRVGDERVIQCNIRDISARKRAEAERLKLEEQLRLSQKLEAIGSLAGGVAHDFNNLLSIILSCTGLAMERMPPGDPSQDDLLEVKKAGERAAALTRQLLAFSRKQLLQPVVLNLNQTALDIEKLLRRLLGEDIDIVQKLAPDLGEVRADPGQMEQVLMNLVVNARDAMPAGGDLTIETSNVEIDEEYASRHVAVKPGSYVLLAVSDTGCGMDPATVARIFEPFFTTKERGKGTGLGLSTVYGIVKQSGGNIWVYSEPGQGTTFKIYLPRDFSGATPAPARPSPQATRARGTETILVVEDEEGLLDVVRRSLAAAGYTVLGARNGEEALEACRLHPGVIDLLLTDVVMPKMGGRALALALGKLRPGLKVLYMSGYTDEAIVHHGALDPGTQFLAKPFVGADLTRRVREILDGS